MDERVALHTAARRYCMERAPGLDPRRLDRDRQEHAVPGDPEAYFTAYGSPAQLSVLHDILLGIESLAPEDFATLGDLRTCLVEIGRTASSDPEGYVPDEDVAHEIAEERRFFCAYIEGLSADDLHAVAPLPHRRVLSREEVDEIWLTLGRRWGVSADSLWYPLADVNPPHPVVAFQEHWFERYVPQDTLRRILAEHGVSRVWMLTERHMPPNYEMDLALFILLSGVPFEQYWASESADWILYTSHEYSLAVGGEWLLDEVKRVWPDWEDGLYTDYMDLKPLPDPE